MLELVFLLYLLKFTIKESMHTNCLLMLFGHASWTQKASLTVAEVTLMKDHAKRQGSSKVYFCDVGIEVYKEESNNIILQYNNANVQLKMPRGYLLLILQGNLRPGGGHFNIFVTGYVPLGSVSFLPFLLPSRVSFPAKMLSKGYTIPKSFPQTGL